MPQDIQDTIITQQPHRCRTLAIRRILSHAATLFPERLFSFYARLDCASRFVFLEARGKHASRLMTLVSLPLLLCDCQSS
jgi:hypothetical protein